MENFVIGMALFLLLVIGFYGMKGVARKLARARVAKSRIKMGGPPPLGHDVGDRRRTSKRTHSGKTESAESEIDPIIFDRMEPVPVKRTAPPSPHTN